jgi:hypothetical protein
MQGIESNYNASQTRLMAMAGVGANPTAGGQLGVEQGNLQLQQQKFAWDRAHPGGNSGGGSGGGGGASSDPWASYYATQDAAAASQAAQKQMSTPDYGAGSYDSGNYGGSTGGLDSSGNYSSGGGMTDMSVV